MGHRTFCDGCGVETTAAEWPAWFRVATVMSTARGELLFCSWDCLCAYAAQRVEEAAKLASEVRQ